MTTKSLNKRFALLSVAVLAAGVLASTGMGAAKVGAADTSDQVSSGKIIINAKGAAPTFTKNAGDTANASGADGIANNGTTQSPVPNSNGFQDNQGTTTNNGTTQTVNGANMANVTFSATKITPTGTAAAMDPTNSSTYTTGAVTNETTNASGVATFDFTNSTGADDGYYLIQQVTLVGGVKEINNFIVQVNSNDQSAGDLQVYPKLDLSSTNPDGTVNSSANAATDTAVVKGDKDTINSANKVGAPNASSDDHTDTNTTTDAWNTTTAGSGDTVTLNLNTTFDISQVTNNDGNQSVTTGVKNDTQNGKLVGSYAVNDTVQTGLTPKASGDAGYVVSDGTSTLTQGTDYNVTVSGQNVTVALTVAGQEKVENDLAANTSNATIGLNVQIPTTVSDTATAGSYKDTPSTTVNNAYGTVLSNALTGKATTVNIGQVDFTKVDQANANTKLAGATFVLVQANTEGEAQALVEANHTYFDNTTSKTGASNGPVTTNPTTLTDTGAAFVTDSTGNIITTTTDSNGLGVFQSLNLVDSSDTSTSDFTTASNYYAVEVKAPSGYQLPSAGTGDNVFQVNASTDPTTQTNTITNAKPFALPFTGGEGLAGIIIIATVAGVAAIAIRRRKGEEEQA